MAQRALHNQMTRAVRVSRYVLIETLKKNREKHITEFNEAMAGYKDEATTKIEEAFKGIDERIAKRKAEIVDRIESFTTETASTFRDHFTILEGLTVHLKVPVSYVDAYDAAIDMASFDTRDELELTGAEFQCFCRDVWDWTHEFAETRTTYASKKL